MKKDKDRFAPYPPMGWNSWDCYMSAVTEAELLENARYQAEHLLPYGWEYVTCDIQWYEPTAGTQPGCEYIPFAPLCMDGYGRLIPAENRFPSSTGGKGFAPIAAELHRLGLKFGIHIMRGIPRQAVYARTPVLNSGYTADQIADPSSICLWNSDMFGTRKDHPGAQAYYDSLFELYASWGVDFVKVDDIANTGEAESGGYAAAHEIEMIRRAGRKGMAPESERQYVAHHQRFLGRLGPAEKYVHPLRDLAKPRRSRLLAGLRHAAAGPHRRKVRTVPADPLHP